MENDFLLCIAAQRKPSLAAGEKTVAAVSAASEDFSATSPTAPPMSDQPGCSCSICEEDYVNQSDSRGSVSQSADLRTRIIAALLSEDDVALMADAVIRELGLTLDCGILRDPYCVKCGIPHPDGKCGR